MSLAASYEGWQGQDCSHSSQGLVLAGVLRLCPAPITLWPALDWECSPLFCACLLDLFAHPSQQLCKLLDVLLMHPVSLNIRTVSCDLPWNLMLVPQASNSTRVAKAFSTVRGDMAGYRSVSVGLGALCVRRSPTAKHVLRSGFAFPAWFTWLSSPAWPEDVTVVPLPARALPSLGSGKAPQAQGTCALGPALQASNLYPRIRGAAPLLS